MQTNLMAPNVIIKIYLSIYLSEKMNKILKNPILLLCNSFFDYFQVVSTLTHHWEKKVFYGKIVFF